jgi:hypothetical protein
MESLWGRGGEGGKAPGCPYSQDRDRVSSFSVLRISRVGGDDFGYEVGVGLRNLAWREKKVFDPPGTFR